MRGMKRIALAPLPSFFLSSHGRAQAARRLRIQDRRSLREMDERHARLRRWRRARRQPLLQKAYGMADLEHDVPNTPDTIFEAGSVSKQFTAAAVLLLARGGQAVARRSGAQVHPGAARLRRAAHDPPHAAAHQRAARLGRARVDRRLAADHSRVHTHAHVLDIVSRQKALNFPSGHAVLLQQHRLQPVRPSSCRA